MILAAGCSAPSLSRRSSTGPSTRRSVLPLIPAVGILLARRLDELGDERPSRLRGKLPAALVVSGLVSLWVVAADVAWANSERDAAGRGARARQERDGGRVVSGALGLSVLRAEGRPAAVRPLQVHPERRRPADHAGGQHPDSHPPQQFIREVQIVELDLRQPLATMRWRMGAGFYSSFFGPLPFVFGAVGPERYFLFRIDATLRPDQWP